MKNFLIIVLAGVCALLFYDVKFKTRQLDEEDAKIADLSSQIDALKQPAATAAKTVQAAAAPRQPAMQPPPPPTAPLAPPAPPPVTAQTGVAAPAPGPQSTQASLDEFAAVMNKDIATPPPPFALFMDQGAVRPQPAGEGEPEEATPQADTERRLATERYNNFVTHIFPGKPELRVVVAREPGSPEASSAQADLSPAKILGIAADDASPDSKYAVRWMKNGMPQVAVAQGAMQTLDQQLTGRADAPSTALARNLHDAQGALHRLMESHQITIEDQRQLAFFLRTAGVAK